MCVISNHKFVVYHSALVGRERLCHTSLLGEADNGDEDSKKVLIKQGLQMLLGE